MSKLNHLRIRILNISLERPYKELLNALISFEIRHSKLNLREVKNDIDLPPTRSTHLIESEGRRYVSVCLE